MKLFRCGKCDKILEDKYAINHPKSEITWYNATEHEERIKKVDELQENSNEKDKEKKVDDLATLKAKLHDLEEKMKDIDDDELNDLLETLRAQLEDLEKLKPDKNKQSRQSSLEYLGYDSSLITESKNTVKRHSVLLLEPYESVTHSGDRLLMKMGSTDSDSVSDTSGDELLKSLGSVD